MSDERDVDTAGRIDYLARVIVGECAPHVVRATPIGEEFPADVLVTLRAGHEHERPRVRDAIASRGDVARVEEVPAPRVLHVWLAAQESAPRP